MAETSSHLWRQEIGCSTCLPPQFIIGRQATGKTEISNFDFVIERQETVAKFEASLTKTLYSLCNILLPCKYLMARTI